MKKFLAKFLKIGIPLALGIFLVFYSYSKFTSQQLAEIKQYFSEAHYGIVALSLFFSILSHVLRAYRWNFMLEPLGYKPKFANNFMAVYIAYIMNVFIPKSGEVSRAVVINKYEDVPFDKAFGTIISERIIDLLMLFIFTAAALLLQFEKLYGYLSALIQPSKFITLGILFFVAIIGFFLFLKFSTSLLQKRVKIFYMGLKEGLLSVLTMRKKMAYLLITVLIWALYLVSFYIATFALEETSTITFGTILITFVIGSFAFAFTNSGFGSYPFFVAGILSVFGVAETVGTAFGWIVWTSNIGSIAVLGGLSFILLPLYNKNKIIRA